MKDQIRSEGTEKDKIIQVEISGKGGICHYTYNLCQALTIFVDVMLITANNYELSSLDKKFTLESLFNRFRTNPLKILKFVKLCKEDRAKIVHFQLSQYPIFILLLCFLVKKLTAKKIIVTAHNVISHEHKNWEYKVYLLIYNLTDKIIVHAEHNKRELLNLFRVDSNKIVVIPHGNYMFFNEKIMADNVANNHGQNILFFGYIREYKGLIYLIRALHDIKQKFPNVRLFIVGKPVGKFDVYDEEIKKLDLIDNINMKLDYVPFSEVRKYFIKADIVVLPYLEIYQSGVLHLAYGFAKPVVVTNVGGLSEAVEDGRTGFIVPPKDVQALAEKIGIILNDKRLAKKMSMRALNLARTKFSWDNIACMTFELYRGIAG